MSFFSSSLPNPRIDEYRLTNPIGNDVFWAENKAPEPGWGGVFVLAGHRVFALKKNVAFTSDLRFCFPARRFLRVLPHLLRPLPRPSRAFPCKPLISYQE
jgi:hypothetical protein